MNNNENRLTNKDNGQILLYSVISGYSHHRYDIGSILFNTALLITAIIVAILRAATIFHVLLKPVMPAN